MLQEMAQKLYIAGIKWEKQIKKRMRLNPFLYIFVYSF